MVLSVTPSPSGIGGANSVCIGSSISLSNFIAGGTWSSSGYATVAGVGTASALVTGVTAGTAVITYATGVSCYRTYNVTVKPLPTPILGSLSVCGIAAVTFLSDATAGISWAVAPATVATVSPSGRVYGVSAGTAIVTYNAATGCTTTAMVTVNTAATVAAITGPTNVSHLATISLFDITPGGVWSSSNSALASVDAAGVVTGVGTSGTATISYALAYGSGCIAVATKPITVHTPAPPAHSTTTTVGAILSLADEITAGEWSSSDNTIASVDDYGTISALAEGSVLITHTTTGHDGTVLTSTTRLQVNALPFEVRMVPNPNTGSFTITGTVGSTANQAITIEITDMLGQVVYRKDANASGGNIDEQILLNNNLSNGIYLLNVKNVLDNKVLHFVISK